MGQEVLPEVSKKDISYCHNKQTGNRIMGVYCSGYIFEDGRSKQCPLKKRCGFTKRHIMVNK